MASVQQPPWQAPAEPRAEVKARLPKLTIYNSLTRRKDPFVPIDPDGKTIRWYACGPTVYDDSHLGHARNYVCTDIIRRILTDYFKYDVHFVMNITDVDDKIIIGARRAFFLRQYAARHPQIEPDVLDSTVEAFQSYVHAHLPLLPSDTSPGSFESSAKEKYGHVLAGKSLAGDGSAPGDQEAKCKMHINTASTAAQAVLKPGRDSTKFYEQVAGVLSPWLDAQYKTSIDPSDHSVFTALTKEHEKRFFDDMDDLNVRRPDTITRVTEYGPQIVSFVEQIERNGFAYEIDGSVYFDVKAWEAAGGVYARLEPWSKNDQHLRAEGEGALSDDVKASVKKSPADFAIWKASRPGEPGWTSPRRDASSASAAEPNHIALGRPGWHIECSAMATDTLKDQLDIHSGGIDLAFPHHDNELCQSEAFFWSKGGQNKQWVNYFLHIGHLSIQGAKMSKSLKNFITIRASLSRGDWTPRSLRLAFLLGNWQAGLEITPEVITTGNAWEEKMTNFFLKAKDLERHANTEQGGGVTSPSDETVLTALTATKQRVDDALRDSFDTPSAMRAMSDLVTTYNSERGVSDAVTRELALWLTQMVNMFGLDSDPQELGWSGIDIHDAAKPYVYPLAALRDEVRRQAIKGSITDPISAVNFNKALLGEEADEQSRSFQDALRSFIDRVQASIAANAPPKSFLQLSDEVRDTTLWNLGIYLEDREGQPALVRPLTASLRDERGNREQLAALKLAKQAEAREKAEREAREKLEKGKVDPKDMFRTDEFSEWDAQGFPTKDKEGKEVAKSRVKKLRKEWERQEKLHEQWKLAQAGQ